VKRAGFFFTELDKQVHDRKSFDCGELQLNRFIQQFALRHRKAGISKTFVYTSVEEPTLIIGFYTLTHTEIERSSLTNKQAKKLPMYPVPVMLIAQLAVDKTFSGKGYGKVLLVKALQHCYEINKHLPSYAIVVDVLHDSLISFYENYGFKYLDRHDHKKRFYLPMSVAEQLFK